MDTLEQDLGRSLDQVISDIKVVFEAVHLMLNKWDSRYHHPFIDECMKLQELEIELSKHGYNENFVRATIIGIYNSVFSIGENRWDAS